MKLECWQLTCHCPTWQSPPGAVLIAATTNPERATNRHGLTENKPSFIWKPHVISRQSPFAANVVPKLVAMATSLRLSSRLCLHWIAWSRKRIPRIKMRVASCHTAEVIWIQSLAAPPTHQGDNQSQRWMGDPVHVWYGRPHLAKDWLCCFRFEFPIFPALGNGGAQNVDFWPENRQKLGFSPLNFVRGHV